MHSVSSSTAFTFRTLIHSNTTLIHFVHCIQFVIFSSWKVPWNWIAFYQTSFVISPGLLYHLIRRNTGRLTNKAFTSNSIVSLKQQLSSLKITNCIHGSNCSYISYAVSLAIWSFRQKLLRLQGDFAQDRVHKCELAI